MNSMLAANSILAAPSATISPDQGVLRYSGSGQLEIPNLWIVPPDYPDTAARAIDQRVIPPVVTLPAQTMDAAWVLEVLNRFLTPAEEMVDSLHGHLFISTWMAKPAAILPIVSLADRSRAAIDELTKLDPGWDGYDGSSVLPRVAKHALRLLEAIGAHTQIVPDVVPLSNGGLQLEWYVGIHEIEVEIAPDCATRLHRECTGNGSPTEVPIGDPLDISEVAAFFRALRR